MESPHYWSEGKAHLRKVDAKLAAVIDQFEEPPLRSKRRPFGTGASTRRCYGLLSVGSIFYADRA